MVMTIDHHTIFKVVLHSVLNMLNHEDSAIECLIYILGVKNDEKIYVDVFVSLLLHISGGTYHRQFVKFARLSMFRSWAKILLFL